MKRYDLVHFYPLGENGGDIRPSADGDWVRYNEAEAEIELLRARVADLERERDEARAQLAESVPVARVRESLIRTLDACIEQEKSWLGRSDGGLAVLAIAEQLREYGIDLDDGEGDDE